MGVGGAEGTWFQVGGRTLNLSEKLLQTEDDENLDQDLVEIRSGPVTLFHKAPAQVCKPLLLKALNSDVKGVLSERHYSTIIICYDKQL